MHASRPRDWSRFEREMRVWARRFERDMRAMGAGIEVEMGHAARPRRWRWGWCEPGARWAWADGEEPAMHGETDREERRAARAARRAARAGARGAARRACRGGPLMWAAYWWWLVFPLYYGGRPLLESVGGWAGIGAGIERAVAWSLNLTLAAPLARVVASGVGVSFLEGFVLLGLAAVVASAAALLGLKAGRPHGVR